jgi:hypothetical protein
LRSNFHGLARRESAELSQACRGTVEWALDIQAALDLYSHSRHPIDSRRSRQCWPLPDEGRSSRVRAETTYAGNRTESEYPRRSSHLVALPAARGSRKSQHKDKHSTLDTRPSRLRRGSRRPNSRLVTSTERDRRASECARGR